MSKEKSINDEKALIGKLVSVQLLDRAETEWDGVRLTGLNEHSALVEWEARGVLHQSVIPRTNISYISLRYKNDNVVDEEKTI